MTHPNDEHTNLLSELRKRFPEWELQTDSQGFESWVMKRIDTLKDRENKQFQELLENARNSPQDEQLPFVPSANEIQWVCTTLSGLEVLASYHDWQITQAQAMDSEAFENCIQWHFSRYGALRAAIKFLSSTETGLTKGGAIAASLDYSPDSNEYSFVPPSLRR